MKTIDTYIYHSPVGDLILGSHQDKLCLCDWYNRSKRETIDQRLAKELDADCTEQRTPIHDLARKQLTEYFQGNRKEFTISLLPVGTGFQKQVWQALTHIPYGQTLSYKELAGKLGDERAVRAVAAANGANVLAIVIPCHRVLGQNGKMVGYAGGKMAKRQLLQLEQNGRQEKLFKWRMCRRDDFVA